MSDIKLITSKILTIALTSSSFKIGKTGLKEGDRLNGYGKYKRIKEIVSSKDKETIDKLEAKMIIHFINWKNNDNKNKGSAGEMAKNSDKFFLYVVYVLKRKAKKG